MTDINSRLASARDKVGALKTNVARTLADKNDGTVKASGGVAPIRSPPSTKCRRILKGHFGKVTAMHWAGNSATLVSASQDGNVLVWNAVTANKLQSISLKSSYVMSVALEQTRNNMVACGGLDNMCTVYRLDQYSNTNNKGTVEMASHDGFLSGCRFISEQHILTSSGDSTCIRWDIPSGRVLDTFAEHQADAMSMSLRPKDANVFLSSSVDKTIKLWDIRTPKQSTQTFVGHQADVNGVEFLPCNANAFCTCSEDGTIRLWDVRAYNQVAQFGNLKHDEGVMPSVADGFTSIAPSRSGRMIFCGHSDGSVVAYDVLNGGNAPAFVLPQAHDAHVSAIGVSPNGDGLCTASWDCNLKIWA